MTLISTPALGQHLESTYNYQIVGMLDLDQLVGEPRNTLYKAFKNWHKDKFDNNDRIVLYSRNPVAVDLLTHIQQCSWLVDISNFFILICSPLLDNNDLESVRQAYSNDDNVFSTLEINFSDESVNVIANKLINLPDSFCFSPWAHLEINSLGEFRPCCVYKESIKNSNNQPYNINSDNVEEVYNSDYLTQLRSQFTNGMKPDGCSHCWYKEQTHGISNRMWTTTRLGLDAQCLNIEQDSIGNLISLDIKLGNLCNFKCRICSPESSSRVAEEQANYFKSTINLKEINSKGQWVDNSQIWKMFEQLGNQLVNIDFYGGEPFFVKQHEIFLNYLIEHGYAKKIRLHYNSNGSIYPKHLLEKWELFREVDIAFSIDNTGERFELERGGSWNEVETNLNNFLKHKLSNMVLNIFTTINVQNIYYLNELINWVETKDFNALHFNMLEDPEYFKITAMGSELTKLVIDKLNQMSPDRLKKYNIYPIIKSLRLSNNSNNLIDKLAQYMLKLDNIRNQKFIQTHPEIAHIIYKGNNHGKTI
jgi:MoaA/NifB/PqqE/SkfB family radical SAM enzyme